MSASQGSVHRHESAARTLARTFCLAVGATLVVIGVLGLVITSADFGAGNDIQGQDFIIFEVNGWHNVVHIASGALLLLGAARAPLAAAVATAFGLVYAVVTVWGFIDGNDVFNLIPVDTADNVLHAALTGLTLFVGLTSGGVMAASRRKEEHAPAGEEHEKQKPEISEEEHKQHEHREAARHFAEAGKHHEYAANALGYEDEELAHTHEKEAVQHEHEASEHTKKVK